MRQTILINLHYEMPFGDKERLRKAISREFPYARFSTPVDDNGSLVCEDHNDSTNLDRMRTFAKGFLAATKKET